MAFSQHQPLTETELDRLEEFLQRSKGENSMNIEELDGFFAALIAGPEVVLPSEYLPEVFGGEMSETCQFAGIDEANDILGLLMRHWNTIAARLYKDDVYLPILLEDEDLICWGNDWARGFMRGVDMRRGGWAELLNDEEQCGWLVPVLILYHEHDEDPEMRPGPIDQEKREAIIVQMAAGLVKAYQYFRARRQEVSSADSVEPRRSASKVGRNDPCPCGSGKKYKRCCGGATIH